MTARVELPTAGPGGERCDCCYYAVRFDDEDESRLACHKKPPAPNFLGGLAVVLNARDRMRTDYQFDSEMGLPYLAENAEQEYFARQVHSCVPEVDEDHWCGEFRAKPDSSPPAASDDPAEFDRWMFDTLPLRLANLLESEGFKTFGQLLSTDTDRRGHPLVTPDWRGFGRESYRVLVDALNQAGKTIPPHWHTVYKS